MWSQPLDSLSSLRPGLAGSKSSERVSRQVAVGKHKRRWRLHREKAAEPSMDDLSGLGPRKATLQCFLRDILGSQPRHKSETISTPPPGQGSISKFNALTFIRNTTTATRSINPAVICSSRRHPPKQLFRRLNASRHAVTGWLLSGNGHALSTVLWRPQH